MNIPFMFHSLIPSADNKNGRKDEAMSRARAEFFGFGGDTMFNKMCDDSVMT